jgi:hypothetical protein
MTRLRGALQLALACLALGALDALDRWLGDD